jgi:SpoIIAA-like
MAAFGSCEALMIEIVPGFPDNVVAISAKGRVTRADYEAVLLPLVAAARGRHPKLRCYYELGAAFAGMDAGAMWEDFKLGIESWTLWERVAVVTDVAWIRHVIDAVRFLVPCEIRIFAGAEADSARRWLLV